jgi:hypothetical protein
VAQVTDFPPRPAVAGLVFPSAGLSPVPASPDSSFSPAHELSARAVAGYHFALCSRSEVFMGFDLDFLDSFFSVLAQLQSLVSSMFFSPRSDLVLVLIPGRFSRSQTYVKSFHFVHLWIFAGLIHSSSHGHGLWSVQRAADR